MRWDLVMHNKNLENVAKFEYFVTTVTNRNYIPQEIKIRQNLGNACYPPIHKFSSLPKK
jgi:hypothetical protein